VMGSGVIAEQHSVTLSWEASSSTGVVGYRVYRSGISGGPYAQISTSPGGMSYIDNTVSSGKSYFYVVTAVAGNGAESAYSNQVGAIIPTP
jgi:fibronectin type 3 domain-containing protein